MTTIENTLSDWTTWGQPDHQYSCVDDLALAVATYPTRFSNDTHQLVEVSPISPVVQEVYLAAEGLADQLLQFSQP